MNNRILILDVALVLFNEQGTASVSTNHIAQKADISPGNLYYHFENKEEIIRNLFERLFHEWDRAFQLPKEKPPTIKDLDRLITNNYKIIWAYRFAYREMGALLRNDTLLRKRYLEVRQRGYEGFIELFESFVDSNILIKPSTPKEMSQLIELCWIISEQWPVNLELSGKPLNANGIQRGADLMRLILNPYIRNR